MSYLTLLYIKTVELEASPETPVSRTHPSLFKAVPVVSARTIANNTKYSNIHEISKQGYVCIFNKVCLFMGGLLFSNVC